jgi:hypothetical protein
MNGRVIAEFTDYDGMLDALRARVAELDINGERFDEFAGLPRGYLSKLIGTRPVRRIGMTSMGPLFDALGISGALIENDEATARLQKRLIPRNRSYARRVKLYVHAITDRKWRRIQKLGRQARWKRLSKKQRSEIMRMVRHGRR